MADAVEDLQNFLVSLNTIFSKLNSFREVRDIRGLEYAKDRLEQVHLSD